MRLSNRLITTLLVTILVVSGASGGPVQLTPATADDVNSKQTNAAAADRADASAPAQASDRAANRRRQSQQRKPTGQDVLRRFDVNRDGQFSEQERAAMRRFRQSVQRRQGKKNLPSGRPGPKEQARLLQRFDKDQDGRLNGAERAAARQAREAFMKRREQSQGRRGRGRGPIVDKPDRSRVDKSELVGRFDKDGDGKLNNDERTAALKAFQSRSR